mmetsp:Transcript_29300/g.97424  ORF Transcript_29300/g.97424 Transcript_29300/m.97424 type:complete len:213 (-) Transcript_29300:100-738(-)
MLRNRVHAYQATRLCTHLHQRHNRHHGHQGDRHGGGGWRHGPLRHAPGLAALLGQLPLRPRRAGLAKGCAAHGIDARRLGLAQPPHAPLLQRRVALKPDVHVLGGLRGQRPGARWHFEGAPGAPAAVAVALRRRPPRRHRRRHRPRGGHGGRLRRRRPPRRRREAYPQQDRYILKADGKVVTDAKGKPRNFTWDELASSAAVFMLPEIPGLD